MHFGRGAGGELALRGGFSKETQSLLRTEGPNHPNPTLPQVRVTLKDVYPLTEPKEGQRTDQGRAGSAAELCAQSPRPRLPLTAAARREGGSWPLQQVKEERRMDQKVTVTSEKDKSLAAPPAPEPLGPAPATHAISSA